LHETDAIFLQRAVRAKLLDPDKGTAALYLYSQLKQRGAKFTFQDFLCSQGMITHMAIQALEGGQPQSLRAVSTVGDYQLLETVGEGENGVVFRALQQSLDRIVALKILNGKIAANRAALQRFQNEARATARLNHPNIVAGIDVGTDQGLHYFAMEFVDGGTATEFIESCAKQVPEDQALGIVRQAAAGLHAAHALGMLHKDVKPDNILLTKEGVAKLADLGISEKTGVDSGTEFWASPPYAAPEVIKGGECDARADLYSLGATLFELLAGHPPYVGATPRETLQMHLTAPLPDVRTFRPEISEGTALLITRMLARNLAQRYTSAAEVIVAIDAILNPPPEPPPPTRGKLGVRKGTGNQGTPIHGTSAVQMKPRKRRPFRRRNR